MSALPSPFTLGLSHPLWASVSSVVSNGVWPDHTSQPFFFASVPQRNLQSSPKLASAGWDSFVVLGRELRGTLGTEDLKES